MTVYDQDTKAKIVTLSETVAKSDYIVLSSRRVYISIFNNAQTYPYTSKFYKKLFSGDIGYSRIKDFTNYPYGISDDSADESFQSYDHPPVIIFENNARMSPQQIQSLILK